MKLAIVSLIFILVSNCDNEKKQASVASDLEGEYYIIQVDDNVILNKQSTFFKVEDKSSIIASIGCNNHNISYEIVGNTINCKNIIATEKACIDLMDLEYNFQKALKAVSIIKANNKMIHLLDEKNEVRIVLDKK